MSNYTYSVIVPVYNSAGCLEELFNRVRSVFNDHGISFDVVFVDDNSKDESWETLKKIKTANNELVKIIRLAKNYGQQNATLCGFNHATGQYLITMDDDLMHPPEEIPKLIEKQTASNSEVIYGIPSNKGASFKRFRSKSFKSLTRNFSTGIGEGTGVDNGSSFRLMMASVAEKICAHNQHFIFIDELVSWYTDSVSEVLVEYAKPKRKSGYTPSKLTALLSNLIIFYTPTPLKLLTYIGLIFSITSFCVGMYYVAIKVFYHAAIPGFTALIVAILFATSIIMLCFGIIGQSLSNIYTLLNKKPGYSVKEKEL